MEKIELEYGIPDIIHVHYPSMITIPDIILEYKKYGTRVFATEHWTRVLEKKLDTYEKQHLRKYINEADRIMCVGEPLRQAMLEMTKTDKMITVLPNVVPDMFGTAKKTETDTFVFIAIGRLVPVKQFDKIITAFSECVRINKKQKMIIVGGGSEFRNLKKRLRNWDWKIR